MLCFKATRAEFTTAKALSRDTRKTSNSYLKHFVVCGFQKVAVTIRIPIEHCTSKKEALFDLCQRCCFFDSLKFRNCEIHVITQHFGLGWCLLTRCLPKVGFSVLVCTFISLACGYILSILSCQSREKMLKDEEAVIFWYTNLLKLMVHAGSRSIAAEVLVNSA